MSTRCCVKVVRNFGEAGTTDRIEKAMLYHHHDGYPEGVGVDLKNRSLKWPSYYGIWDMDEIVNSLIKDTKDEYEFTVYDHTDIEYLYTINCNKMTITCNKCRWIFEDEHGNVVDKSEIGEEVPIP